MTRRKRCAADRTGGKGRCDYLQRGERKAIGTALLIPVCGVHLRAKFVWVSSEWPPKIQERRALMKALRA